MDGRITHPRAEGDPRRRHGLHLLPSSTSGESQQLQSETKEFLEKTKAFNEIVADFITVMEGKSKVIEAEKLKAIGLGNRVTSEAEVRKRKQLEVQGLIAEKKAELDRLSAQHDSLMMVETAQRKMIDNLTNNGGVIARGGGRAAEGAPPCSRSYVACRHRLDYCENFLALT